MTSDDIVNVIQRRVAVPLAQETFTVDDLLDFVNSELYDSQVPTVMLVHEEFFVYRLAIPLVATQNRYAIPDRAIGLKLRDLFYQDQQGNLKKLSRINPDNQDIYQTNNLTNSTPYLFFVEGNDVVLTLPTQQGATGSLLMTFYLRPNKLVQNENAFIVSSFSKQLTVNNATLVAGDTLTIFDQVFTAVSASPSVNEFLIDITSIATASNLVAAINTNGVILAGNNNPAVSTITLTGNQRTITLATTSIGISISPILILNSVNGSTSIESSTYIDFLQTKPGHKTYKFDILLDPGAVTSTTISFTDTVVPNDFVIGDYICTAYTCIIPQIPPELHSLLAERACARLLSAQGDVELLADVNTKIQKLESNQNTLIDNRVEGSPQKVVNRNSFLTLNKYRSRWF